MDRTKRLHDDEWYDEIRITTEPRYKTSSLSGDEWRTSAQVQILRKGIVLTERGFSKIDYAVRWLAWGLVDDETDLWKPDFPSDLCSQPGCPDDAITGYAIKVQYEKNGSRSEYQPKELDTRQFCARHAERGDSDMEDRDSNYEVLWGPGPLGALQDPSDVSEAVFLGTFDLTEDADDE